MWLKRETHPSALNAVVLCLGIYTPSRFYYLVDAKDCSEGMLLSAMSQGYISLGKSPYKYRKLHPHLTSYLKSL